MIIVLIKNSSASLLFTLLLLMGCKENNQVREKSTGTTQLRSIDSMQIGIRNNDSIKLNIYDYATSNATSYIYLKFYAHSNNKGSIIKLPGSVTGYDYGTGFSDSFDSDNLISSKISRQQNDFVIVHYEKRRSFFYYFVNDEKGDIRLDKIFRLFRYSGNYGVEQEEIEVVQFNVNRSVCQFNISDFNAIEKIIYQDDKFDSVWNYEVLPNSDEIKPVSK